MGIVRSIFSFFIPGGLLLVAAVISVQFGGLAGWLPKIVKFYPYAMMAVAVLFGLRFNKSRLIYGILAIILADRILVYISGMSTGAEKYTVLAEDVVALLLPLNLMVFSLLKERGILTLSGVGRLMLILIQPVLVALICDYQYAQISSYLHAALQSMPVEGYRISRSALLISGLAFLVIAFRYIKYRDSLDHGFLWALVMSLLALAATNRVDAQTTFYFSTAGLILIVAAFESAYTMVFRDELTGLPARRALHETLAKLRGQYTIAMLDIDFFKKFNDRYGHDVGDQVLRMVGSKLLSTGGGAKVFRYGGEEFTVIFPGRPLEDSIPHLEKLRRIVASSGFNIRSKKRSSKKPKKGEMPWGSNKKVSVTVSIGVAERQNGKNNPHEVVKEADKALYRAKNGGRNRLST